MAQKAEIEERFASNIERVRHLVTTYEGLSTSGKGRRTVRITDILRAATVFLHATLEDLLRSIEEWKLPLADEPGLEGVPLVGSLGRVEKFPLSRLAMHRGKTVDALIEESVRQHLGRTTYSDTAEICGTLARLKLQIPPIQPVLPTIDALIKRRHDIVHRADRDDAPGQGHHGAKALGKGTVTAWIWAVEQLASAVLAQL